MNTESANKPAEKLSIEDLINNTFLCIQGPNNLGFLRWIIVINVFVLFARPQHSLPFISSPLPLTLILSLIPLLIWLPQIGANWTRQTKLMLGFIVLGAAWVPFARNNHWAFHNWRDLTQQFLCFIFPMVVFLSYGKHIQRLMQVIIILAIYLSIYSLTHAGTGPGGFIEDENDLCLVLVAFLPLPWILFSHTKSMFRRLTLVLTVVLVLAGTFATMSRGGFVGLVCVMLYLIWKSQTRIMYIMFVALVVIGSIFLAPRHYWNEMSTIHQTDSGTAKERTDTWKIALKAWLDPRNVIAGVGMGNDKWVMKDYEPTKNWTEAGTSLAGRAVHSLYAQILVDLGIIGSLLLFNIVLFSFQSNQNNRKKLMKYIQQLEVISEQIKKSSSRSHRDSSEKVTSSISAIQTCCLSSGHHLQQLLYFLTAINAGWVGILSAGAFISVLYYPPIWFFAGLSATLYLYINRLVDSLDPFLNTAEQLVMKRNPSLSVENL